MIRRQLLEEALRLFMARGIQNVTLTEIVEAVGISKPFFYKLYPSYGDLIGEVVDEQRTMALEVLDGVLANDDIPFKDEVNAFLSTILSDSGINVQIMMFDVHGHIYKHQSHHAYSEFQKNRAAYYEAVLHRLGVPEGELDASVFGNLYLLLANFRHAEETSLVYMFDGERDATFYFAVKLIAEHISNLRVNNQ